MNERMSAQQADKLFTDYLINNLKNSPISGDFDSAIRPIIDKSIANMEYIHNISIRFNEDAPHGLRPQLSCHALNHP
jgi:hypothetical protein